MNKKMILAAMALALTISSANAAGTDITGITGQNGVFDINAKDANGQVLYRDYQNFILGQGDRANMNFRYNDKDYGTFVNLVRNKVDINGILNTVKDGNFYNGHAVFITPGGFTVGASGVLNVGSLHVATPSTQTFDNLIKNYGTYEGYQAINKFSELKNDSNADVVVNGKIFANQHIDLRGNNATVAGSLINGVNANQVLTSNAQADALFNSLVNTNGALNNAMFEKNGGMIYIRTQKDGGLATAAGSNVINGANGQTYLINEGSKGLTAAGKVYGTDVVRLHNAKGDLGVAKTADLMAEGGTLALTNEGKHLTVAEGSKLTANGIHVVQDGVGQLSEYADARGHKYVSVKNNKGSDMVVGGNINGYDSDVVLENKNGNLFLDGKIANKGATAIVNYDSANALIMQPDAVVNAEGALTVYNAGKAGMKLGGNIENVGETLIHNRGGEMVINGNVNNSNGLLHIIGNGEAQSLSQGANSKISNSNGLLAIENKGKGNMVLAGTVEGKNAGDQVLIDNYAGGQFITGTVNNNGKAFVMNRSTDEGQYGGQFITGKINNNGDLTVYNQNSAKGMTITGEIAGEGNVLVQNRAGEMNLGETSKIVNKNGKMIILADEGSTGLTQAAGSVVKNEGGLLSIGNRAVEADQSASTSGQGDIPGIPSIPSIPGFDDGSSSSSSSSTTAVAKVQSHGMTLNGTIEGSGDTVAINNHSGDLVIGGTVKGDKVTGIMNREGNGKLAINGKVDTKGYLIAENNGKEGMQVAGEIANSGNATVIRNKEGQMTFGKNSKVATDAGLYIIGEGNSKGIAQAAGSVIQAEAGELAIQNKGAGVQSGEYGMNLAGTVANKDGNIDINNHSGSMAIQGKVQLNEKYTNKDRNQLAIVNREGSESLILADTADVELNNGSTAYIMNLGSGNEQVGGSIKNDATRVNIVANEGALTLKGKYTGSNNKGTDALYAISRANGKGVFVTEDFEANGTGDVYVENLKGANGMNFSGKINTNGKAMIVNQEGDMNINGKVAASPVQIINNTGAKGLYFRENADISSASEGQIWNFGKSKMVSDPNAKMNNMKKYEKLSD